MSIGSPFLLTSRLVARQFVVRADVNLAPGDGRPAVGLVSQGRFLEQGGALGLDLLGHTLVDQVDHVSRVRAAEHGVVARAALGGRFGACFSAFDPAESTAAMPKAITAVPAKKTFWVAVKRVIGFVSVFLWLIRSAVSRARSYFAPFGVIVRLS